jgi:hypothetical protein
MLGLVYYTYTTSVPYRPTYLSCYPSPLTQELPLLLTLQGQLTTN